MRRLLLTAAALLLLPVAAAAQKPLPMQPGTWTGTVTPPNGQTFALTVEVVAAGDSVTATMAIADAPMPPFPLQEIKLTEDGKLVFGFDVEVHVICTLTKKADAPSWEGGCAASDGSSAPITLTPPKKEG